MGKGYKNSAFLNLVSTMYTYLECNDEKKSKKLNKS